MSGDLEPTTQVYYTHLPAPFPASPAFNFQLTRMKDTLFVWVGTGAPGSDGADDDGPDGPQAREEGEGNRLASEWAVAMPSAGVSTAREMETAVSCCSYS